MGYDRGNDCLGLEALLLGRKICRVEAYVTILFASEWILVRKN